MTSPPEARDTHLDVLRQCTGSDYGSAVPPTKRRTPQHTVAVDNDDWTELGEAAKRAGLERSVVLRAFIGWYIRKPGAKLPPRPGD